MNNRIKKKIKKRYGVWDSTDYKLRKFLKKLKRTCRRNTTDYNDDECRLACWWKDTNLYQMNQKGAINMSNLDYRSTSKQSIDQITKFSLSNNVKTPVIDFDSEYVPPQRYPKMKCVSHEIIERLVKENE